MNAHLEEVSQIQTKFQQNNNNNNGNTNYYPQLESSTCNKCNNNKTNNLQQLLPRPPRTHHCKTCNRCIIKMDHHCPFMNNCIGISNYRTFMLTIFYIALGTLYGILLLFHPFSHAITTHDNNNYYDMLVMYSLPKLLSSIYHYKETYQIIKNLNSDSVVKFLFPFLCLLCLLFFYFLIYHINLILNGVTTLEQRIINSRRKKNKINDLKFSNVTTNNQDKANAYNSVTNNNYQITTNPYNNGMIQNMKDIFGDHMLWNLLPIISNESKPVKKKTCWKKKIIMI